MNKKCVFAFLGLFLTTAAFADIEDHHRIFEIGVDADVGVSNNYFKVSEIMVKDLVIDLTKIASELPDNGLSLNYDLGVKTYLSLNIKQKFGFSLFAGVNGNGYGNIGKELFNILGNGISSTDDKTVDLNLYADIFLTSGISFNTYIKKFGIKVQPTLFIPLVHLAENDGYARYTSSDSGAMKAEADIPLDIFTFINMKNIKEGQIDSTYIQNQISNSIKNVGFDLFLEVEHPITKTFEAGTFVQLPLVPGKLNYKTSTRVYASVEEDNLLGNLNEDENEITKDYGMDELTFSEEKITVHRPLIFGVEGAWRPFGSWCKFTPKVALVIRNPYSADYQVFGEYNLRADFSLFNVLGINFATAYENLTFKQRLGFMFNFRIIELNAAVQLTGADFANSFGLTGASGVVSVKVGF